MKRLLFLATLTSLAAGCSSPETGVRLLNAHPFNDQCTIDETIAISRGSIDLGATTAYNLAFDVQNDLTATETSVGGEVVQPSAQNNFFVEQIVYNYTSNPPLTFNQEITNAHFVVEPGSDDSWMSINLLAPEALTTLLSNVNSGDYDLLVTIKLKGRSAGGKKSESNEVSFPVRVYKRFNGCPANDRIAPTGPCGNAGQDSAAGCCTDAAFSDACT